MNKVFVSGTDRGEGMVQFAIPDGTVVPDATVKDRWVGAILPPQAAVSLASRLLQEASQAASIKTSTLMTEVVEDSLKEEPK